MNLYDLFQKLELHGEVGEMASIRDLEEFQELVGRYGAAAVIASSIRDLAIVVNSLSGVLGEIDASGRAVNANLHKIVEMMTRNEQDVP